MLIIGFWNKYELIYLVLLMLDMIGMLIIIMAHLGMVSVIDMKPN